MRKLRITAVVLVAVIATGALYQLPAGPFAHREFPERPIAQAPALAEPPQAVQGEATGEPTARTSASVPTEPRIAYPDRGPGTYAVLPGDPATLGRSGRMMTYQFVVEGGITGLDRSAVARFVRETYAAPDGWTAGGRWRFRQVGPGQAAAFQLMFVTPGTRDRLCGGGYDHYTSCRIGKRVVLNIARWVQGVPGYGAPLAVYRQYMVSHETGHRLGEAHELCPGPGRPAPVMQQQTLGLHGCTANAWPYRSGRRYEGRLGKYDDSVPTS
ncbi:uncharacterized protein DUF3152 [Kribbella amoyensis]|uniref:Uncharacterized protein DUF3152 n=1 Tax=Kribbella amoyensis TaxID=996641 RepID=A0A561BNK8_9ACTN|nr:DUF3152 domain-containing protein [Kribbella amoyensis]TWD80458.1 uncharacterized protein DUF3152 [Kribbella amoyensis]